MSASVADAPPNELRFRRRIGPLAAARAVWRARELVRTLAERELRARYKQAMLGLAWALITPLALMLVFTLFFNRVAQVETGGAPYPLFSYLGLLPWTFFSTSVSQGGQSLIQNIPLLNKVYFPREVFPTASVAVAGMDSAVALLALGGLFAFYGFLPRITTLWVPVLLLVQVAFTLGVTLVVSAVVVYLRDLRHALPVLLQIGLFATPVAYGIDFVPGSLRMLYVVLNPLAAVIDGYRRTVLLGLGPDWDLVLPAAISALVVLTLGYLLFKRMEAGFADVA
jgi:ABC-type polysaccharide/polyol phosphate export permease